MTKISISSLKNLSFEEENERNEEVARVKVVVVENQRLIIVHQGQYFRREYRVERYK